jgi:hypothetical protein
VAIDFLVNKSKIKLNFSNLKKKLVFCLLTCSTVINTRSWLFVNVIFERFKSKIAMIVIVSFCNLRIVLTHAETRLNAICRLKEKGPWPSFDFNSNRGA